MAAAQPLEAGADLVMVARLDDPERARVEQSPAAGPGVVEQDEGAAQPCHASATGPCRRPRRASLVCSTFDLFKIGVGPSSSHTMGPMTAACTFVERLRDDGLLGRIARVEVDLYGSLALTGKGHATDRAMLLGLSGERPDRIDPDAADRTVAAIRESGRIRLGGEREIAFDEAADVRFLQRERLPHHSNGMRFTRLRRRRRRAARQHLLFGRRRRGGRRGGGRAQRPARGRLGRALRLQFGRPIARHRRARGPGASPTSPAPTNARPCPTKRSTPGSTRSPRPCRPASTGAWRWAASCPAGST